MSVLTEKEMLKLAIEKYPIENPKCATERYFKKKMREEYIEKLRKKNKEVNL